MKIRANTAVPIIENMFVIINSPNGVDIYAKDESGKSMMPMGNSQTNERLMLQLVYRLAELNSEVLYMVFIGLCSMRIIIVIDRMVNLHYVSLPLMDSQRLWNGCWKTTE